MFGEQPNPTAMAQQTSNMLDAYMDVGQQNPMQTQNAYQPAQQQMGNLQGAPLGGGMPQQNPTQQQMQQRMLDMQMAQQNPMRLPMMPQAPNFSQMGQEDPRMQAMRHMQRYRGGQ